MTAMALEGASVVLTAKGPWMWASGKQLKVKVGKGSGSFSVDDKGVLLWEHVEQAVTQGVMGQAYRHVPAAVAPGTIGKINIRAKKKPTFATAIFSDEEPLVTLKACGNFDVFPLVRSSIPGPPVVLDTSPKHSGSWTIEE